MNNALLLEVVNSLWAVKDREYLQALVQAVITNQPHADRLKAQVLADDGGKLQTAGRVALIPVFGTINRRDNLFTSFFGGTSIERLRRQFRRALFDSAIRGVIFVHDSGGGGVDGCTEFSDEIFKARGVKPIVALVDTLCASASYWLASACDEVIATPSATTGSIGVYTMHEDVSGLLEKAGIEITLISSSEEKIAGNEFEPLSRDARAYIQRLVNQTTDQFRADVARGRGVSVATVKARFGEGKVFKAEDAQRLGLVDRIATLDEALVRAVNKDVMATGRYTASLHRARVQREQADVANDLFYMDAGLRLCARSSGETYTTQEDREREADLEYMSAGIRLARKR